MLSDLTGGDVTLSDLTGVDVTLSDLTGGDVTLVGWGTQIHVLREVAMTLY